MHRARLISRATAAGGLERSGQGPLGKDNLLSLLELVLSPFTIVGTLWGVTLFYEGELLPPYLILSIIVFALTFPGQPRLQSKFGKVVLEIARNWVWVAGLLALTAYATGYQHEFNHNALVTWLLLAPVAELGSHFALRLVAPFLLSMQGSKMRAIIVGMNGQGVALAERLQDTQLSHIELCGFVDSRIDSRLAGEQDRMLLGNMSQLADIVRAQRIQVIYLSLPMAAQPRILAILDDLKDTTASIYFVPDMFFTDLIQGHVSSVCGLPVISVCETPFVGVDGFFKRGSDVLFSVLILLLIVPLMVAIAIAVKWTSPGPVIFKQRRYGLDGEEILVYKFRSMTVTEDGGSITQATKGDNRITPLGAFLRKTSLDELPQFINVLQGRMSIVGPRPHAVAHNELYRKLIKGYAVRHKVRPGITGWAQVNGFRGETDTLDKMQGRIDYDLDYLRHWSLRLDVHIILRTVKLVTKDQAAY